MIPILKDKKSKNFSTQLLSQEPPSQTLAKNNNILPLKEIYIDDRHYGSGNLEIYWLPGDKIIIKRDKVPIFGPTDVRANARSLTVSTFTFC